MKCLKLLTLLLALTIASEAQTDSTFYYLDKTELTNNILCNFPDSVYWGVYDGMHDKTLHNLFALQILSDLNYLTFGSNGKPSSETVKHNSAVQIRQNKKIPLCIIHCEYSRIKSTAVQDSLLTIADGKYYDVLPRSQSPYQTGRVFAAAPLKEKIYEGSQTFLISRDFFISNLPDPSELLVDLDDGTGYRTVTFGQSITVSYANNNAKTVRVKMIYDGNEYLAKAASDEEYCQGGYPLTPVY